MTFIFQRGGDKAWSTRVGSTLFRFGSPPRFAEDPCYTCQWTEGTPTLLYTHGSHSEEVSLTAAKDGSGAYSFAHPEFDSIYVAKTLWFEAHPRTWGERGALMSFQGWSQGLWYDGIYARWQESRLSDLILPGGGFRVEWGRGSIPLTASLEWFDEQRVLAQKQSLIEAVRLEFGARLGPETVLEMSEGSYEEVLTLLLFRLAFLKRGLTIVPQNEGQKRLAQNLNIVPTRTRAKAATVIAMHRDWGSSEAVHHLLEWQLRQSPFIPAKLWSSLQPGF